MLVLRVWRGGGSCPLGGRRGRNKYRKISKSRQMRLASQSIQRSCKEYLIMVVNNKWERQERQERQERLILFYFLFLFLFFKIFVLCGK
jgi:hypothetical protein